MGSEIRASLKELRYDSGGRVQDVVLDLGVGGLGQVSLWKQKQPLCLISHI